MIRSIFILKWLRQITVDALKGNGVHLSFEHPNVLFYSAAPHTDKVIRIFKTEHYKLCFIVHGVFSNWS